MQYVAGEYSKLTVADNLYGEKLIRIPSEVLKRWLKLAARAGSIAEFTERK